MDEKLDLLLGQTVGHSNLDTLELQRIREERQSTVKCLQVCTQLSDHISQIKSIPGPMDSEDFPETVTNEGLRECKESLTLTAAKLERHMQALMDRLITKSKAAVLSKEDILDLERLREEWDTARHGVDICSRADTNLRENISDIENYSTGDALQFMVSTNGKVIHGKNRGLGWRSRQVGGHLSDASVQQISRDMVSINIRHTGNERPAKEGTPSTVSDDIVAPNPTQDYSERYGPGFKLTP